MPKARVRHFFKASHSHTQCALLPMISKCAVLFFSFIFIENASNCMQMSSGQMKQEFEEKKERNNVDEIFSKENFVKTTQIQISNDFNPYISFIFFFL